MANNKRLILLFCICFVDNLNISGAMQCYVCEQCSWKDGNVEECIHACQSVSNLDGSFTKRCSTDYHAPVKCQNNKNCTCTSDLCNGIDSKPMVKGGQTVFEPEDASFHLRSSSGIVQALLGERTNVVLQREPTKSGGRIKRAIKRIYYKSPQVTKTTGSLVTTVQTHKELNGVSTKNTGNTARLSVEMSSSLHNKKSSLTTHIRYNRSPTERLDSKRHGMPTRVFFENLSEHKNVAHSTEHSKKISEMKSISGTTFEVNPAVEDEDSGFTVEDFLNVHTTRKERSSGTTGKRFHSTHKITSNSVKLSNKGTTSGISNSEQHTSVYASGEVTDSPNSQPNPAISTDEDNSGMDTREFPFWPSRSSPAEDNETESTSKETFTTVATVYDNSIKVSSEKEVSTSQAAQPTSAEGTSHTSGLITGNHHKLVTVAQTSETLVTIEGKNEKSSISWTRNGRNTSESSIIPTPRPDENTRISVPSSSTPYVANASHKAPTSAISFSLEVAAELSGEGDIGQPKYPDNQLRSEQEMGLMFTIWIAIGSLCLLLILIGLVMLFVKIFRKNKTYVIN